MRCLLFFAFLLLCTASRGQGADSPLMASFQSYRALKQGSEYGSHWRSAGPVFNSVRAETVQAHPDRPGWMYVAFGSGNLCYPSALIFWNAVITRSTSSSEVYAEIPRRVTPPFSSKPNTSAARIA